MFVLWIHHSENASGEERGGTEDVWEICFIFLNCHLVSHLTLKTFFSLFYLICAGLTYYRVPKREFKNVCWVKSSSPHLSYWIRAHLRYTWTRGFKFRYLWAAGIILFFSKLTESIAPHYSTTLPAQGERKWVPARLRKTCRTPGKQFSQFSLECHSFSMNCLWWVYLGRAPCAGDGEVSSRVTVGQVRRGLGNNWRNWRWGGGRGTVMLARCSQALAWPSSPPLRSLLLALVPGAAWLFGSDWHRRKQRHKSQPPPKYQLIADPCRILTEKFLVSHFMFNVAI